MKCPVCGYNNFECFLKRKQVPIFQNVLFAEESAAISGNKGDLELLVCNDCGFIFNALFEPAKLEYGLNYDNNQIYSYFFQKNVDDLVSHLLIERNLRNSKIVEVGCGKGYFLRKIVEGDRNNTGLGFDPSYIGPEVDLDGRLRFEKRLFTSETANIAADVVICRHVIEHMPEPIQLLHSIHQTIAGASTPRVFLETPCVEWILRNQVVWDFFYEHCSYFSMDSLKLAVQQAGFQTQDVRHLFGEQYLWLEATARTSTKKAKPSPPNNIIQLCRKFGQEEGYLVNRWRDSVAELAKIGPVALWGAGAKGVTLANLVDPERSLVACVVDLNPQKQGKYLPGTGHPIINYLDLPLFHVKYAVQMNPNYAAENLALLHEAQLRVTLINPNDWREIK
ncbi:MAG: class I SAM-dependent methyltransferase [Kiritimatiellia bacterium]|nr:class I SAM-dependent methyltransferase [Kiritimatiellia bacterium]